MDMLYSVTADQQLLKYEEIRTFGLHVRNNSYILACTKQFVEITRTFYMTYGSPVDLTRR